MPALRSRPRDITGVVFGRLTVVARAGSLGKNSAWRCRCACGRVVVVRRPHLETGRTRSCGCWNSEAAAARAAARGRPHPHCTELGCTNTTEGGARGRCRRCDRRWRRPGEATFVSPEIEAMLARRRSA